VEFHLADLFECLCDAGPDAEALVAGDRRVSRGDLDSRANRLAHHLQSEGVKPGDHVGIYAYNRVEWVEALLACWKIRAAAVNVNYRYVVDELRYIWDNSDIVALVYERGFSGHVAELAGEFPALRSYLVIEDGSELESGPGQPYEEALSRQSPERGFSPRSADDHYIVYTGGTTGMPKGVLWRHEDLFRNVICSMQKQMESPEEIAEKSDNANGMRSLTLSPLMHGGGQFPSLITLFNGGVALFPVSRSLDPKEVLEIIESEQVMMLSIIGDAMGRPIAEAKLASTVNTSSLAVIASGGAILTEPVRELLLRAFGDLYLTGGIGGSEIGSAAMESGANDATQGPQFSLMASVAVLDEDLEPVVPGSGQVGRMARRGYIPIGYYKDEKKTAETFVTDARGVRWVLPGDLARVEEDGSMILLGRGSQCINSGGEKIFVEEVERVIRLHPAVRLATVVGVPDPTWQQRVVALVELEGSSQVLTLDDLQTHCRRHLAGYKIPRALFLTDIPRTPTGKADYRWATKFAEDSVA
jgi:acyl-CoA synthetase (AMP-forming)/AMP-acid ligase II